MATAGIVLRDVTKRYGNTVAVDRLSLRIEPGSFTTLLGPSGCGKTTLLRLIGGFLVPDAGEIEIDGRSIVDLPAYKRPTATVFQDYALFPHLSVFENIAYGLRVRGLRDRDLGDRVGAVLDLLNIRGLEHRAPHMLSGGQQQRVALARAVVVEPGVLLMDEPLSNLDAKLRGAVRAELRALHERLGITTVYVTHDQEEALVLSDWIAVMREGRVVQGGTPQEIHDRPADPFVADFVGLVNFLDGILRAREGPLAVMEIEGLIVRIQMPTGDLPVGCAVRLAVRPSALEITRLAPEDGDALPGTLRMSTYLGTTYRHYVAIGRQELMVDQVLAAPLPAGTPVFVRLPKERTWLYPAGV